MKILVIGSHGKVGKRLVKILAGKSHKVVAMVRKEEQVGEMQQLGAEVYYADLEDDFSAAFNEIDIVVFTAGSGGHTGAEKTIDIDQNAAIKSIDLALKYTIKRYIMVSAQGARSPEIPSKIQHYYKAKSKADIHLINSGQNYTIFRPGRLTDEAGTGKVEAAEYLQRRGETSRDNLALAIAESVSLESTDNKIIEILDGNMLIGEALKRS